MTDSEFLDALAATPLGFNGVIYLPRDAAARLSLLARRTWFMVQVVPGTDLIQLSRAERDELVATARYEITQQITKAFRA